MILKELLQRIKCLPRNTEVFIHEVDKDGNVSFQPLKGISLSVYDKRLSFGVKDFSELEFEAQKKKGFFCKRP